MLTWIRVKVLFLLPVSFLFLFLALALAPATATATETATVFTTEEEEELNKTQDYIEEQIRRKYKLSGGSNESDPAFSLPDKSHFEIAQPRKIPFRIFFALFISSLPTAI